MSPEPTTFAPLTFRQYGNAGDDARREEARRRGYTAGYADGRQKADAEAREAAASADALRAAQAQAHAEAVSRALAALTTAQESYATSAASLAGVTEDKVIALAVELAEAIIGAELSDTVQAALNAAARSSRVAVSHPSAVVALNPGDLSVLDGLGELPETVTFESSVEIAPGDSAVHLPDGEVDLRVSTAIARVRDTISREQS